MARTVGILCAVLFHIGVILFGGIFFMSKDNDKGTTQEVSLLSDVPEKEKEKPKDPPPEKKDEIEPEKDQPPDATEVLRNLDQPLENDAPALDAATLSQIEAALNGSGGAGGDFGDSMSFASGGRIGGTGRAGAGDDKVEDAFSLDEIDQKPRAIFQASPLYPSELRGKKLEGVVTLIFVVDASGRVTNPKVEKSTHPAFEKPALEALKQWKFEAAVKGGQRVGCKMRVPIRFQASS